MTKVCSEIFRAIHEGKWLSIEYKNKKGNKTNYWIRINKIIPKYRQMIVDGLHLVTMETHELNIYIDSILQANLLEGTYCEVNRDLLKDIVINPSSYAGLFDSIPNLKVLNYLADCNRLDTIPYKSEYQLIHRFDGACFTDSSYRLDAEQFSEIVTTFQTQTQSESGKLRIKQLALNLISIPYNQGLYVLAYQKLFLDVSNKSLRAEEKVTFCKEFTINGTKVSIRKFLPPEDYLLLDESEPDLEKIRDAITVSNPEIKGVDDMPYVIAIGMDAILNLEHEYAAILDMYDNDSVTDPIRAFFGEYLKRSASRKQYTLALLNKKVNLDQLLAINNAMKFPITYIQGPPGTGKTNTILNTVMSAFFNNRTVLFSSNNNHPIDEVFKKMRGLKYNNRQIPFPIVRLGNQEKVESALDDMRALYENTKNVNIFSSTLDRNREEKVGRTKELSDLLKKYDEIIDLRERREVLQRILDKNNQLNFRFELQHRHLDKIDRRLKEIGEIKAEDALRLVEDDEEDFLRYLYYISAKNIKRLSEKKNKDLLNIILSDSKDDSRVADFNHFLSDPENVRRFLSIFPIVATTNISAYKIGEPEVYFDMVIMDEASQCSLATSLVPIIRGKSLMLVGDPQQLQPVIVMDPADNALLRKKYEVQPEYDYIDNSVYKTFLSNDPVSDEILLHYHYRCHKKIIAFNNKKYYNGKLKVESDVESSSPLVFVDIKENGSDVKNTAPGEIEQILGYVKAHPKQDIGIITPFTNQKDMIDDCLRKIGRPDITCGTVHAFQGDEKDVILFSLGLSRKTGPKTYGWLKNNRELINVATSRARKN